MPGTEVVDLALLNRTPIERAHRGVAKGNRVSEENRGLRRDYRSVMTPELIVFAR